MGENLALNIESRGYRVAVFNRTTSKVDDFIAGRAKGLNFAGCHTIPDLVANLAKPRKVMLMVKAGPAIDELIEDLLPLLDKGDIIIDGGNTFYADTERRTKYVEDKGDRSSIRATRPPDNPFEPKCRAAAVGRSPAGRGRRTGLFAPCFAG
jgi:6-phosphogluconate dehydrogenase